MVGRQTTDCGRARQIASRRTRPVFHRQLGQDRSHGREIKNRGSREFKTDAMSAKPDPQRMEKIVSLCKRRGFIFQSSEIYGGLNGCLDYGPGGVGRKGNVKDYGWRVMVRERDDVVGMDGAILMSRAALKASGHEDTFTDLMVEDRLTGRRFRADQVPPQSGPPYYYGGAVDETRFAEVLVAFADPPPEFEGFERVTQMAESTDPDVQKRGQEI